MELVAPRPRLMHVLQAVNPDLTVDQIMALMQFSFDEEDEGSALVDPTHMELVSMEEVGAGVVQGHLTGRFRGAGRAGGWAGGRRLLRRPLSGTPRPDTSPRLAEADASEEEGSGGLAAPAKTMPPAFHHA